MITFTIAVIDGEYDACAGDMHCFKGAFVVCATFLLCDVADGGEANVSSITGKYTFTVDAAFAFCGEKEDGRGEMLELLHQWMFLLILLSICRVLKCCCHYKC